MVVGPTCLSTVARRNAEWQQRTEVEDAADSDSESDSDQSETAELADGLWLMDTGSGHALTTPKGAEGFTLQQVRKIIFSTANGRISTSKAITVLSTLLKGTAVPYILPETPWVLSIGKRCMEAGYSFIWVANTKPWLVSPDGTRIDLEVHGNIPFLRVGDIPEHAMVARAIPRVVPTPEEQDHVCQPCAPVKVRTYTGCTSSSSWMAQKDSVVLLDSDEGESEAASLPDLTASSSDPDAQNETHQADTAEGSNPAAGLVERHRANTTCTKGVPEN